MIIDKLGNCWRSDQEIMDLLYQDPDLKISKLIKDSKQVRTYNNAVRSLFMEYEESKLYMIGECPPKKRTAPVYGVEDVRSYALEVLDLDKVHEFNQQEWKIPESYAEMDIVKWVIEQCKTDEELDRVGQELILYSERNLIPILQYLKYLIDTMRKNKVVWGVGRGSSTASYVLYIIGVHRIHSIKYQLDIHEFLKD